MRRYSVWRIQRFAIERVGDHRHRAVMLPAHDAAVEVLARQLSPLKIEAVAVAVVGRTAECRDPAIVPDIAVLHIARDVAEDDVLTLARPSGALGPQRPCPQPVNRTLIAPQRQKRRVDDDDVGIGIDRRVVRAPFPWRIADDARRSAEVGVLLSPSSARRKRRRPDQPRRPGQQPAARQRPAADGLVRHRSSSPFLDLTDSGSPRRSRQPPVASVPAMRDGKGMPSISR